MNSSQKLLLLWGMWTVTVRWATSDDFISHNMKEDLEKLKEHFNTSDKALFRNPVFLKNLQDLESNFEDREQRVLLREVLTVYLDILAHMTHDVKDKNLRHSLNRTRERVAELRQHYFQSKGLLKTHLKELWDIKTGDPLVQRKAIRELKTVFHKASVLGSKKQLPARRRRQASRRHV